MTRLLFIYLGWIVLVPILIFYLKTKLFNKLKQSKQRETKLIQDTDERRMSHLDKELKEVYLFERYPLYFEVKKYFNIMMKEGKLSRSEILYIKQMINKLLGGYLEHYKKFKFESDAHEIYIKLKNQHLDENDFKEIRDYLVECKGVVKSNSKKVENKVINNTNNNQKGKDIT